MVFTSSLASLVGLGDGEMWYISSPEKAVVPGQCPDAGLFPSLTSGDAGVVKVEPGPAIFYLNTSSEVSELLCRRS